MGYGWVWVLRCLKPLANWWIISANLMIHHPEMFGDLGILAYTNHLSRDVAVRSLELQTTWRFHIVLTGWDGRESWNHALKSAWSSWSFPHFPPIPNIGGNRRQGSFRDRIIQPPHPAERTLGWAPFNSKRGITLKRDHMLRPLLSVIVIWGKNKRPHS